MPLTLSIEDNLVMYTDVVSGVLDYVAHAALINLTKLVQKLDSVRAEYHGIRLGERHANPHQYLSIIA